MKSLIVCLFAGLAVCVVQSTDAQLAQILTAEQVQQLTSAPQGPPPGLPGGGGPNGNGQENNGKQRRNRNGQRPQQE